LQLRDLEERLQSHHLGLEVSDAARHYLIERGYDPQLGARPLKRLIQRALQDRLALMMLGGELPAGHTARVDAEGDKLVIV